MRVDRIEGFRLDFGRFDDDTQGVELTFSLSGEFSEMDPEAVVRVMAALLARIPVQVSRIEDLTQADGDSRDPKEVVEKFLRTLDNKNGPTQ